MERDLGFAVVLGVLRDIPVNKIPHRGNAVISNSTVCDVCVLNLRSFCGRFCFIILRCSEPSYAPSIYIIKYQSLDIEFLVI